MAKMGIKYPVAAIGTYTAKQEPTYADGFEIGAAMAADKEVKFTNNPLYANDAVQEDETSFESGTLKLGVDEILLAAQAKMYGHKLVAGAQTGDPQTLQKGAMDQPPFLGVGYYKTAKKDNKRYFETTWLYKVKFTPPKESAKSQEGKVSWQTQETEGTIYQIPGFGNDVYEEVKQFTTEVAAIEYLNTKAGITTTGEGE